MKQPHELTTDQLVAWIRDLLFVIEQGEDQDAREDAIEQLRALYAVYQGRATAVTTFAHQ